MSEPARDHEVPGAGPLQFGDWLDVRDPMLAVSTRGSVTQLAPSRIALKLSTPLTAHAGRFAIRRKDADGLAWYAECEGEIAADPTRLELALPIDWQRVDQRGAARFPVDRHRLVVHQVSPVETQRELVALDVSATGCRASGQGTAPPIGASIRLSIDAGSYDTRRWIHAVVARVHAFAFGRFEVGLRFDPESDAERRLILQWRDNAATTRGGTEDRAQNVSVLFE